jgi:hypothetical protein
MSPDHTNMPRKSHPLKAAVLGSPRWRAFFSVAWTLSSGVLCSAFVAEISTPAGLKWSLALSVPSFYAMIGLGLAVFFHTRALYRHETRAERFIDEEYCTAYMRSQCLPEAAERYKALIRKGNIGELERAMEEVKRVLK